jgi:molybdopterin synthase catalytic subunit
MQVKNIFITGAIDPVFITAQIAKHSNKTGIGGHSIFLGQVRADQTVNGRVEAIEYTSHEEMALEKMDEIREEIIAGHKLTCLHVFHSLGLVKAGAICLFVFASAPHRKEAMEACEACVERIKAELPVWGKEITDSGDIHWKVNT